MKKQAGSIYRAMIQSITNLHKTFKNLSNGSIPLILSIILSLPFTISASDWPLYSYDLENTNHNPNEIKLNRTTVRHLERAWQTFNDDSLVNEAAPSGFVLEQVLGLSYPNSVVGVTASPIILDGTIYYIDQLGTVFARHAKTGTITHPNKHWTTTLVDPDFANSDNPVLPELIYTAPVVTDNYIWIAGSVYGRLHAVERSTGREVDFKPNTPEIDPHPLITDLPFASVLGDSVIVQSGQRTLFITGINVILNDALVQGAESGVQLAIDITDPLNPTEAWRRFSVDINPVTGLRYGTGVSVGSGLAVDTRRKLIFGGTGQNSSVPYPEYPDPRFAPAGYVDRGDALYAINYLTGEFVWHNQFHQGDVFDLNNPVSTGPNRADGPRDADVLSPPVLWRAKRHHRWVDMAGVGSKGGLYRAVNRATGQTLWERQISKPTGLGGIQAGSAFANGVVYVAGFEGIDDGFSDAQFGVSFDTGQFPNAFFATFSPQFWADVEDTAPDNDPATGMRIKVYALDAATGESKWHIAGKDFVALNVGAALRHVTVANNLLFVTTTGGQLFVLDAQTGQQLFVDRAPDLNQHFSLGLGKAHHASMNTGVLVADGMVYTGYGAQNNPSGGIIAYRINERRAGNAYLNQLTRRINRMNINTNLRRQLLNRVESTRVQVNAENHRRVINRLNNFANRVKNARGLNDQQRQRLLTIYRDMLVLFS